MENNWKIRGSQKTGWLVHWGADGLNFPYSFWINKTTEKTWKTLRGATKFGLKHFGKESLN